MSATLSDQAKALLEQQRQKYLDSLPRKKSVIASAWRQVRLSRWEASAVERLKTEIHRLSGSAGSYGLDALGAAARQLDGLLSTGGTGTAHRESVGAQIQRLLRSFDEITSSRA